MAPRDGEAVVSWLRRVSFRYDVPAWDLLKVAGAVQPVTGTSKVVTRLRNNPALLDRLGLTEDETRRLLAPPPLLAALEDYVRTFNRQWTAPPRWSRFCPACLTDPDPHWLGDWHSPLSLACFRHTVFLVNACPGCGQYPLAGRRWLSKPGELWRCPSQLRSPATAARTLRPWCGFDLRDTPTQSAALELCDAQRLLADWAAAPAEPATACGLVITGRIGVHAFIDLVDASLDAAAHTILQLASPPQQSAAGYLAAADVLTRPTLNGAAATAARLLSYNGPHAPIRPAALIETHPYSPLLAALQLHGIRDQLSPTDQLTFRTSHPVARYPVARYPATLTPDTRNRLRLPEHRIIRPERNPAWFPPTLWPDVVPDAVDGPAARPLHRACLAMALAKLGSGHSWTDLADAFGLPALMANSIGAVLQSWVRAGTWPHILATLDAILVLLQTEPPPIDYPLRRQIARNVDLLDHALTETGRTHPSPLDDLQLLRVFWEMFTGGDICYGSSVISLNAGSRNYQRFRQQAAESRERDLPRLQCAHQEVTRTVGVPLGPLTWTPKPPATIVAASDGVRITAAPPATRPGWPGFSPF